jgi:hypothetical protein
MKKTYSEKTARIFETVNYFLLIPVCAGTLLSIPLFLYATFWSLVSLFSGSFVFGVVIFAIYFILIAILIFGIRLMIGYFRHSRGRLEKEKIDRLWIKTIVFNTMLFFPLLYLNLQCWFTEKCFIQCYTSYGCNNELNILSDFSFIFPLLNIWLLLAINLAFNALASIRNKGFTE